MALPGGLNLEQAISGVTANDARYVREQVPGKLSVTRALLERGRLQRLRNLSGDVRTLFEILTDRTFSVPWRTTAAIVFALGYFVLSFDVIPDAIPVLGFFDDALVIAEVLFFVSADLQRYRAHRAESLGATPAKASAATAEASTAGTTKAPRAKRDERMVA